MARSVKAKIKGMDELIANLRALGPAVERAVGAAVFAGADAIRAEAQHSITAGSISGAGHVPSKPGEPPNADTRQLDTSMVTRKTGPLSAEVVVNSPHAVPLEFGTQDGRLAERPYMRPAIKRKSPEMLDLVSRAALSAIRKHNIKRGSPK